MELHLEVGYEEATVHKKWKSEKWRERTFFLNIYLKKMKLEKWARNICWLIVEWGRNPLELEGMECREERNQVWYEEVKNNKWMGDKKWKKTKDKEETFKGVSHWVANSVYWVLSGFLKGYHLPKSSQTALIVINTFSAMIS